MAEELYTWVPFYTELANKLLPYKNDRAALIDKLQAMYESIDTKLPKLDDGGVPNDIDPFTIFGLFNKGISSQNRRKIVAALADVFCITAELPNDFAGTPLLNNLNATFYAFIGDSRRGESDIDNLWDLFEAELALADADNPENRNAFAAAFDKTVGQFGLGWKLTMGLYWARPLAFINLDSRNRWFMGDTAKAGVPIASIMPKEKDAPIHDGKHYLAICDTIRAELNSADCPYNGFPSLSNAAFIESERVNREKGSSQGR